MVIRRFALIMSSTFPTFASVVAVRVRPALVPLIKLTKAKSAGPDEVLPEFVIFWGHRGDGVPFYSLLTKHGEGNSHAFRERLMSSPNFKKKR
ncbi:hypothetical protein TNCT_475701 [Trichonephila clavata]|uniref:Ribosomal protein S19 n=1 Tax=Trichonephila clavata TaxID=2740835 RepID=A0A8X6H870_TRICU|nr:hypothetical protein TNCT_475701 [Trichonephila clavata]